MKAVLAEPHPVPPCKMFGSHALCHVFTLVLRGGGLLESSTDDLAHGREWVILTSAF